jgi:hypothetical protein
VEWLRLDQLQTELGGDAGRRSYAGAVASQSQRSGIARGGRLGLKAMHVFGIQPGGQDCPGVRPKIVSALEES